VTLAPAADAFSLVSLQRETTSRAAIRAGIDKRTMGAFAI
jgi:hypothetical protein